MLEKLVVTHNNANNNNSTNNDLFKKLKQCYNSMVKL